MNAIKSCLVVSLDVNPISNDKSQGSGSDNDPESKALEKGTNSDFFQGLLVETGADEEESDGESDAAKTAEGGECRIEGGQQGIQKGGDAKQANEPGPLNLGFALESHGGDERERNDPEGASEFHRGADGEGGGAVTRGSSDDGTGVVDGKGGPESELRLAEVEGESDGGEQEEGDGVQDKDCAERDSHFFLVGVGDRSNGGDGAASADGCSGGDEKRRLFADANEVAE